MSSIKGRDEAVEAIREAIDECHSHFTVFYDNINGLESGSDLSDVSRKLEDLPIFLHLCSVEAKASREFVDKGYVFRIYHK